MELTFAAGSGQECAGTPYTQQHPPALGLSGITESINRVLAQVTASHLGMDLKQIDPNHS